MRGWFGFLLCWMLIGLHSAAHAATHEFRLSGLGNWKVHDLNTTGTIPVDFKPILVHESSSLVEAVDLNPGAYAVTITSGTLTILRDGAEVRQATGPTDFTLQVRARRSATFDRTTRLVFDVVAEGNGQNSGNHGSASFTIATNDPAYQSTYREYYYSGPLLPGTVFVLEGSTHCLCQGPGTWTSGIVWVDIYHDAQSDYEVLAGVYCGIQSYQYQCDGWGQSERFRRVIPVPGLPAPDPPDEAWIIE